MITEVVEATTLIRRLVMSNNESLSYSAIMGSKKIEELKKIYGEEITENFLKFYFWVNYAPGIEYFITPEKKCIDAEEKVCKKMKIKTLKKGKVIPCI